jgi:hypothetical protein
MNDRPAAQPSPDRGPGDGGDRGHVRRFVVAVLAIFVGAAILLIVVDAVLFP